MTVRDKRAARSKSRRISEGALFAVALAGGAAIMFVTMGLIRHKTKHMRFMLVLPVMLLLQAVFFYWFNTYTLRTTWLEIEDRRIRNEITIVQLTDLHGASFGRDNARLLSRIARINPDVVLITGDMWTRGADDDGVETAVRLLNDLGEKYPLYVTDGGHDGYISVLIETNRINATFLNYETAELTIGDTAIAIHGVPEKYYRESAAFDLSHHLELDRSVYNVLIAHEARFQEFRELGADLSLVGHTHGGIVRLPLIGTVYHRSGWFIELREMRDMYGFFEDEPGGAKLFISAGLGLHPEPVRLFNRPEVVAIRLKPPR